MYQFPVNIIEIGIPRSLIGQHDPVELVVSFNVIVIAMLPNYLIKLSKAHR